MGSTLLIIILLLVTLLQAFSTTTTTTTTTTTVSMSVKSYDFATGEFPCRRCKFYMRVTSGTTAAPPAVVAAAMPENPTSPSKKTNVGAVVGFTFLLVFILTTMFVCIYRSRRSRSRPKPADHKQEVADPPQSTKPNVPKDPKANDQGIMPKVRKDDQGVTPKETLVVEPGENSIGSPKTFTYKYLSKVTNNFDFKNMIGGGNFGTVFKGTLTDGTVVAVKCLRLMRRRRIDDFKNEVDALAKADHFNLVKLIGYCDKSIVKILVFEYMKNGSLDRWISNTEIDKFLNWPEMKNIIRGIALGLEYLHKKCDKKILHRDLKPANIILDENKNAKLCDFGLAKLLNKDQTSTSTACAGSWVYMAPEAKNGRINDKVDVYSFGAVVLEIMFGKHFVELVTPEEINNVKEFKSFEGLIGNLREDLRGNEMEIKLFAKLAMYCLNEKPENRPDMSDVVEIIDRFEPRLKAMKLSEKKKLIDVRYLLATM